MKRWGLLCGIMLLWAAGASAQDFSRVDVFAGYSYVHTGVAGTPITGNLNGGSASVSVNPTNWLGIVGDFGGYHGGFNTFFANKGEIYTYMFGPKTEFHVGRFTPFVQSLFGGAHASSDSVFGAESGFAMASGGGIDVSATRHFGIRVLQAEYILTTLHDGVNNRQNSVRLSAGFVFRW